MRHMMICCRYISMFSRNITKNPQWCPCPSVNLWQPPDFRVRNCPLQPLTSGRSDTAAGPGGSPVISDLRQMEGKGFTIKKWRYQEISRNCWGLLYKWFQGISRMMIDDIETSGIMDLKTGWKGKEPVFRASKRSKSGSSMNKKWRWRWQKDWDCTMGSNRKIYLS